MKPNLHPNHTLIALTMILATTIRFPTICCQNTKPYNVHGRLVQCENIRLGYLSNHCIHNYESLDYRFLGMNNSMQTTTISRNNLWSNFFPQYLYNTTYNSTLIGGNSFGHQNVSLYHGCDFSIQKVLFGSNYEFSCYVNGTQIGNYLYRTCMISRDMLGFLLQCNNHVIVPVKQSSSRMTGFNLQRIANGGKCFQYIRSNNWCESNSTSPELSACYCSSEIFLLACNNSNTSGENSSGKAQKERKGFKGDVQKFSKWKWKLVVGFSCGAVGIMLLLFVILYQKRKLRKTQKAENHQIEMFIRNCRTLAPKRYKYSEIKKMTNSFQVKLGQGGYGSVYKGKLPDGQLVAVKLLGEATGDGEDFYNEVASISRTSHVNIVTLLGFCIEGKKRALMYEFMPNGSLDKFLCGAGTCLDWNTLFRIAKGIARGLEYLHQGCNTRIVHFDIKPHNILLDEEFVPKLSDFGLAKLCTRRESIVSVMGARGTAGYMAPEVFLKSLGGASHKSDVYSYGMMVLEMTGAHKNNNASLTSASETYFPDWIYKLVEAGDNLDVYGATTEEEKDLAKKMMTVSLWCIQSGPSDRPSISKVVEMLEGSFQSLQVPRRGFLSSPTLPSQAISTLATESSIKERVLTVHTTDKDFTS